jgi:hypothetical protein
MKKTIGAVFLLTIVFFIPEISKAEFIIDYQNNFTTQDTSGAYGGFPLYQGNGVRNYLPIHPTLVNGDPAVPGRLELYLDKSGFPAGTGQFVMWLVESTGSNSTTTLTGNAVQYTFNATSSTKGIYSSYPTGYAGSWTNQTTFDPTKYYGFIYQQTVSQGAYIWGVNSGSYGYLCYNNASFTCSNSTKAPFYRLYSSDTAATTTPYIYNTLPANNSTTTTSVTFQFSYNAPQSYNITNYTIDIIDFFGGLTPIYLSGGIDQTSGTITRNQTLLDGHLYQWSVYICQNAGGTCYSGAGVGGVFGVGTSSENLLQQYFGSASTTETQDFLGAIPIIGAIVKKVPFGYISQFYNIVTAALNTGSTTQSLPLLSIPLHENNPEASSTIGNFLPDIAFTQNGILATMGTTTYNTLIGMQDISYWVALGFYLWRRGLGLFRPA